MLAMIAAKIIFFRKIKKVPKKQIYNIGPMGETVQAKFGWDFRELQTFGLPLSLVF